MQAMTATEAALWQRLEAFRFDTPDAIRTFSGRLAREQGWSAAFALRAIEEYRRFAFLAVAAGHFVSPSRAVDEVWHLHLLYTRQYWNEFCPQVLNKPLHHLPSDGTAADREKCATGYERTLESYLRYFGPPPADVWPVPAVGNRRWETLAKLLQPRLWGHWRAAGVFLVLALFLSGCGGPVPWPLDLPGPTFLKLMSVLVVTLLAFIGANMYWIRVGQVTDSAGKVTAEEAAWLNGKMPRLVATVVARLLRDRHLEVEGSGRLVPNIPLPSSASELDHAIVQRLRHDVSLSKPWPDAEPLVAPIREQLVSRGLIVSEAANRWSRIVIAMATLSLIAFAGAKIVVGMDRQKPVAILCGLTVLLIICLWSAFQDAHRTFDGDLELARLLRQYAGWKNADAHALSGKNLPLALALFGPIVLKHTELDSLHTHLIRLEPVSSAGGVGSGSGCGGGGDGGGCGGGGCGGCGG